MVDFVESATQIAHNANKNSAHEGIARSVMLVRHGQTPYNAQFRLQGMIDIALDESGIDQVTRSGKALRVLFGASDLEDPKNPNSQEHVRITPEEADASFVAIVSPLIRAQQTAHAFADKIGLNVHVENGVRERFFGEWEGLNRQQISERWPEDFNAWVKGEGGELNHGAETKQEVGERAAKAVEEWARKTGSDRDLLVFSHGSCLSQTVHKLLGLDKVDPSYKTIGGMGNGRWARLIPSLNADGSIHWRLDAYDQGPAADPTSQRLIRIWGAA